MSKAAVVSRGTILGCVAGLRSQMPLALIAISAKPEAGDALSRVLRKPAMLAALCLAAAGELVGDKLPVTPSRLEPGALGGRLFFGALAGSAMCRVQTAPIVLGASLGAAGALAGSYAGYHARRYLGQATGIPDPVWAVAEDAAAVGLGLLATRRSS